MDSDTTEAVLQRYFYDGYNNEIILQLLHKYYKINWSDRALNRNLTKMGLRQKRLHAIEYCRS